MRRRLFRRVAATGAMVGGVSGIVANLALMGFFALSRPWQPAASQWAWLGPANDVTGAVSTAALIPVVVYLGRVLPRHRHLTFFGAASILGMAGLTVVAPLMLSGAVSLTSQFVVAGVSLPAMFGWLLVVNRQGRRAGVFPASLATFGERVGVAALVATGIAGVALLVPSGSVPQNVLLGVAAVVGLPAYLAFPVWPIRLARTVLTDAAATSPGMAMVETRGVAR
jgi:hypothetical protein